MTIATFNWKKKYGFLLALLGLAFSVFPVFQASAQSTGFMLDQCSQVGKSYFREPAARTDMKYNGQRTDGTHAINGRVFLETRYEDFACSYDRSGKLMVQFFAEGQVRNAHLPKANAASEGADGSSLMSVAGLSANDVLNVRSGPSTRFQVIGALSNGSQVRNLGCRTESGSRWCRIQMLDDMRSEGWVNARYLKPATAAVQAPKPPAAEAGGTRTVRVRFPSGSSGTELREQLAPGATMRYVLNARNGQFLYVRVAGKGLTYQIFNPNGSRLLDQIPVAQEYRGQLWQSGDHVVEVINRSNRARSYNIVIGIE